MTRMVNLKSITQNFKRSADQIWTEIYLVSDYYIKEVIKEVN